MMCNIDLNSRLKPIGDLGRLVDMAEERALQGGVIAADLPFLWRYIARPETVDCSRSATKQGGEELGGDWSSTTLQQPNDRMAFPGM